MRMIVKIYFSIFQYRKKLMLFVINFRLPNIISENQFYQAKVYMIIYIILLYKLNDAYR
jgi:hypothetical protein